MADSSADSMVLTVRRLRAPTRRRSRASLAQVPDGERRFLKEDLSDPAGTFAGASSGLRARRLVAVEADGELAGLAGRSAVRAGPLTSRSCACSSPPTVAARLGRALARAALVRRSSSAVPRSSWRSSRSRTRLVAMFQDMGFEPEALLADFVRDGDGISTT